MNRRELLGMLLSAGLVPRAGFAELEKSIDQGRFGMRIVGPGVLNGTALAVQWGELDPSGRTEFATPFDSDPFAVMVTDGAGPTAVTFDRRGVNSFGHYVAVGYVKGNYP